MERSKDRKLMRAMAILMLVAVASMVAQTASAREIGYLQLFSSTDDPTEAGFGYIKYDRRSLDPYYELRDAWRECAKSSDPAACGGLPNGIDFELEIIDAEFTWLDRVFTTDDFRWTQYNYMSRYCAPYWYGCEASVLVGAYDPPDFVSASCADYTALITDDGLSMGCGLDYRFVYRIGEREGDSWIDETHFSWREAALPPSVPEPTTLALFGLGLACLSLTRRRKARTLSIAI